jgi:hypothetical protein
MEKVRTYVYYLAIWNILRPFGNLAAMSFIFPRFGIVCQEKSGNPAHIIVGHKVLFLLESRFK